MGFGMADSVYLWRVSLVRWNAGSRSGAGRQWWAVREGLYRSSKELRLEVLPGRAQR